MVILSHFSHSSTFCKHPFILTQVTHDEDLQFGCSVCGLKFKSSSTLSRHRESHAPVKKPIKKLKIKIIDGSCVISKVDSPAQPHNHDGEQDQEVGTEETSGGQHENNIAQKEAVKLKVKGYEKEPGKENIITAEPGDKTKADNKEK